MNSEIVKCYQQAWSMTILFKATGVPNRLKHDLFTIAARIINLIGNESCMSEAEISEHVSLLERELEHLYGVALRRGVTTYSMGVFETLAHGIRQQQIQAAFAGIIREEFATNFSIRREYKDIFAKKKTWSKTTNEELEVLRKLTAHSLYLQRLLRLQSIVAFMPVDEPDNGQQLIGSMLDEPQV